MKFPLPSAKLRLSQQLIITFALVVLVPLVGVSFIIYSINQTALRKELVKFTEHTAETIYKDFNTEMSWQKEQGRMMSQYVLETFQTSKKFEKAAEGAFKLSSDYEAVGLYDATGKPLQRAYRNFSQLSPELRLPESLPEEALASQQPDNLYNVIYFNTGDPKDSPYYLRVILPLKTAASEATPGTPSYYVQLKKFGYLQNLINSHESIYENFYIIDKTGLIIAGPARQDTQQKHISAEDFKYFQGIRAGVTHELSTTTQTVPEPPKPMTAQSSEDEEDVPLQKVFVKIPEINWGIIIESPYHVRQKFIKRANEQSILLIIACLVAVILFALIYVFGINRNFRQLIKGIKALADGNYFRRIRLITNFFTPYEIVYLTGEFNRMAKRRAEAWETLQEANEKLAKLDEFKSNLIDTVSHELRTPLTSIKGYTSRLIRYDDTLDREMRLKSLKIVKQQAERLNRLVEDLLVIPDLEKANLRVFPDEVFLPELLDRCVQFIQMKDQREIMTQYQNSQYQPFQPNPLTVLADPDRLEQILLNLLDNAVKYSTPETPIWVDIAPPLETGFIQITVANESEPIPPESLATLFNKFQRLDDSTVRTTRGSGLGLFITKGLVEAMTGEIALHYTAGRFQVQFTIPLYQRLQDPLSTPQASQIHTNLVPLS